MAKTFQPCDLLQNLVRKYIYVYIVRIVFFKASIKKDTNYANI